MAMYHSQMTKPEWRKAFASFHENSVTRMQEAFSSQQLDASKINWQQTPELVAADVFEFVWSRFTKGGEAIRILAALVGGRDPNKSQCVCGRH